MRIRVVAVGKLKESHYREAVDEYLGRLKHYATVEEVEIKDGLAAMQKAIPQRAHVIAMTIDGRQRSSEELAARIEELAGRVAEIVFVIGGANGIPAEVVKASQETLSLGKMTLPHRLARLVLVEQIYRAMTIRKGEPYHHG